MVKIPWFIPHKRDIEDTNVYSNVVSEPSPSAEDDSKSAKSHSSVTTIDSVPAVKLDNGKYAKIQEFRDEANRPWWKFFDEYEYREPSGKGEVRKWYQWFEPGTSAAEKKLILKLDVLIAFYAFLGYWVKFVDQTNLNNAYVSNMKEDLGMKGNDLIDTQVIFSVGSIIFMLPLFFLLPRVPVTYMLPLCELGWALCTVGIYAVKTVPGLKALRFFVGAFEAAYFPYIIFTLTGWYKSAEVSRRGALFYAGQFLGVLTSGLLQSATFESLDGVHGISGWRWMFLVDGLMSVAVALIGFLVLPGTPFSCYSIWLTDEEILLARRRMDQNGSDTFSTVASFLDIKAWKDLFSSWQFYVITIIQIQIYCVNNTSSGSFALWLKSLDQYSIPRVNNLTATAPAVGIFYVFFAAVGADLTRKRFGFVIFCFLMNFIGNLILSIWDVPQSAKWFAFLSAYWSWSPSPVMNPMFADFYRKDNNSKSIAYMLPYFIGMVFYVWISKLIWPTVDSPKFPKGFSTCAGLSVGAIIFLMILFVLYKKKEKNDALENGIYLYNSATEGIPEIVRKFEQHNSTSISYHNDSEDARSTQANEKLAYNAEIKVTHRK